MTVVIAGDGQLFPEANFLDESRLIIDIPAVSSTLRRSVIRADHYLLKKIRVGHHADKIRLVFDVPEQPTYSLVREANKVLITLKPSEPRAFSASATQVSREENVSILLARENGCLKREITWSERRHETSDPHSLNLRYNELR
ncbi:MAG: AMIN domain-containing protein [Nitrospiraceae bacterium]|nr:AMIN domain-containing protein [Nitrospiraceae bacterium]